MNLETEFANYKFYTSDFRNRVLRTAALSGQCQGRHRLEFTTVGQDGGPNLSFFFYDVFVDQNSAERRGRYRDECA
jgi:hypothetical protein